MSQISISISTEFGSRFEARYSPELPLLSLDVETNIYTGYDERPGVPASHCYAKDHVHIHGTREDLRLFAERIIAAFDTQDVRDFEARHAHEVAERNSQVAEPLRSVVNAISGVADAE